MNLDCLHTFTRSREICVEGKERLALGARVRRARLKPNRARCTREVIEPISKSSEEDNEAGELDKAEEVLSVVLPADEDATLPLYPGEEALDEPAPLVTA